MSLQLVACLLGLASLSAAVPSDCGDLVRPLVLEDHSKIQGKWILHVTAWDSPPLKNDLATLKSSWIEVVPTSDSTMMRLYWADKLIDGKCLQGYANMTVSDTTTHMTCGSNTKWSTHAFTIHGHTSYHEGKYYETCPDCMLSTDTTLLPDGETKGSYIFLFTRTGHLEESQLETFKKQAECLNFLPDYIYPSTEVCADERETTGSSDQES